jgi:hypothetical protein
MVLCSYLLRPQATVREGETAMHGPSICRATPLRLVQAPETVMWPRDATDDFRHITAAIFNSLHPGHQIPQRPVVQQAPLGSDSRFAYTQCLLQPVNAQGASGSGQPLVPRQSAQMVRQSGSSSQQDLSSKSSASDLSRL